MEPMLSGTLTHMTWGGDYTEADVEAFLRPFTEQYGLDYQTVDAAAEMLAKLEAMGAAQDVTIDTLDAGANTVSQAYDQGLIADLPPDVQQDAIAACGESMVYPYGVGIALYANVIACNADAVETCPATPAEFWDLENFPGTRTLYLDASAENIIFALLADGVPADELFPLNAERGFAKLDEIKDQVVWYSSGDQSQQLLRDEEVVAGYLWDGRAWGLVDQDVNVEISYNGATYFFDLLAVAKDGPNPDAAFEYIRWYATSPEAQADWMSKIYYGTCNPEAYELLDPAVGERLVGTYFDVTVPVPVDAYSPALDEAWYTWLGE